MMILRRLTGRLQPWMPYLNIVLAALAYVANEYWIQGFCQPVEWAAWALALSTGAFLLWPWGRQVRGLNYLLALLMGVHLAVCIYCVLFSVGDLVMALFLFFLVLPLLLWVPVVFGVQAVGRMVRSHSRGLQTVFLIGACALLPVQWWAEQQYRAIEAAVATLPPSQRHTAAALARVVPRTYMAERLAGALFKYHNYAEMQFDGWRPPLHDPLVNVSLWLHGAHGGNPLVVGAIDEQAAFYHQLFPALPIKADCTCNQTDDGNSYRDWVPGRTDR